MAVWLCSGQGAQKPGMGADLLDSGAFCEFERVFEQGSRVLGVDLAALAHTEDEALVNDAFNAQALTVAVAVGVGEELLARGREPEAIVGFSLGQVSALALSGMLSVEDTFKLLKVRANAMTQACDERPGAMLAVMGANHEEAAGLCSACAEGQVLLPANFNCPGQVVVSGELAAIERAQASWAESHGARKAVRLRTAGGFHTPLMEAAAKATGDAARALSFSEPKFSVICNTDALPLTAQNAAEHMESQVKSPVRFEQSIASLLEGGATEFAELGYGNVLANLVKRCDRSTTRHALGSAAALQAYLEA